MPNSHNKSITLNDIYKTYAEFIVSLENSNVIYLSV